MERILIKVLVKAIRGYQTVFGSLRVFFGWQSYCSYEPSCSAYAIGCLEANGLIKGLYQGLERILSCHPFSQGGWDPVTLPPSNKKSQ